MKQAALAYAEAGWPVFPCWPRSKKPATPNGLLDASFDISKVNEWWSTSELDYNIAIHVPENVCVLDFDTEEAFDLIKGKIPDTVHSYTPRAGSGLHAWYRLDVPGSISPKTDLLEGMDVRAHGSYVMAPPSVHPNGKVYRWGSKSILESPLAELPGWIIEEAAKTKENLFVKPQLDPVSILKGVSEGARNTTLFRYACRLLGQTALTQEEQILLVHTAAMNADPPYTEQSAEYIVKRAWKKYGRPVDTDNKVWKVKELLATKHKPINWIVSEILPPGFCLLTADAKLGKSMIVGNLAGAVAIGAKAWGKYPTKEAGVLYLDMEQSPELATGRWVEILKDVEVNELLDTKFSWKPINEGGYEDLRKHLIDNPRTRLVIIDILNNIWPTRDLVTGTAYNKLYAFGAKLASLAKEFDIAIIGIHHKAGNTMGKDFVMSANGGPGLVAAADTIWSFEREREAPVGYLKVTGKNVETRTIKLTTHNKFKWHA